MAADAPPPDNPPCGFCGGRREDGRALILGPIVAICVPCVAAAGPDAGAHALTGLCSFCRQEPGTALRGIDAVAVGICAPCLDLCRDIVAEMERPAPVTLAPPGRPGLLGRLRRWLGG
jgi:hypothetical protein